MATESVDIEMIRVAIVDDHPLARRGVAHMLAETNRIAVIGSAGDPQTLADVLVGHDPPDVILLDLYLADMPCVDAIAALSARARVLVMSASGRSEDVLGAIRAGASGYLTKQSDAEVFVAAVETVAVGGFALSPHLADIIQAELLHPRPAMPAGGLSPREQQTLDLIADGYTHSQIATRMAVTKATVDTYVERIRAKLQLGNKAQLTQAAIDRRRSGGGQ
jgi:DNA-binding NarL/FixJ family response regulator